MAARKFNIFIFLSIAGCAGSIVICGLALGTQKWYTGVAGDIKNSTIVYADVNYGLFQGAKTKYSSLSESRKLDVYVVCSEGHCMYSCGINSENRKTDINNLIKEGKLDDDALCTAGSRTLVERNAVNKPKATDDPVFLSFILWLMTIIFIAGAILFSAIGGILGLYNTYSAPFQPILSVFGLYIWNGVAAGCILLTLIMWGVAFSTNLAKDAAISETLSGLFISDGKGSLGYSYWILLAAIFLNLGNIGILRYRTWKIMDSEKTNTRVMDVKLTQGEILLF